MGLHLHLPLVDPGLRNAELGLPAQHLRGRWRDPFPVPAGYPANNLIRDNVFTDPDNGITDSSGANWGTQDHNLNSGLSGSGNITGTPVWAGGSSPTSYGGYHLAPGSPGKSAASDGTDIGIR